MKWCPRELNLICRSADVAVTLGLLDHALDNTDPVYAKHYRVTCTSRLETIRLCSDY